ncbi:hypothetical protein [Falsiroseomonas oryzae]|nr:hypothetical protein [Roseomonas sp. MO-31]
MASDPTRRRMRLPALTLELLAAALHWTGVCALLALVLSLIA